MYKTHIKQTIDFMLALIGLLILSPLFVLITLFLSIANKGKPFFFQARPGKDENIFKIIKFKTMTDEKGRDGELLPDAQRLTAIGSFIRKTSLDEIPQLINVLKGDMSLIGPRPLLIQYLAYYTDREKKRHTVKPGISGLAQVSGRNNLKWDERLEFDVWYTEHVTFKLDLNIILKSIKIIIMRKDIVIIPGNTLLPLNDYRKKQI